MRHPPFQLHCTTPRCTDCHAAARTKLKNIFKEAKAKKAAEEAEAIANRSPHKKDVSSWFLSTLSLKAFAVSHHHSLPRQSALKTELPGTRCRHHFYAHTCRYTMLLSTQTWWQSMGS